MTVALIKLVAETVISVALPSIDVYVGLRYAGRSRFDLIASDGGTKTARAATTSNTQIEGFSL